MEAYLLAAAGAIAGAVGSVVFIMRSPALTDEEEQGDAEPWRNRRQLAVRVVLSMYMVMTGIALVVSVALLDTELILTSGALVVLATIGLISLWSAGSP
jgi:hypothetical protein